MIIKINGKTFESTDPALSIESAIRSFGTFDGVEYVPPDVEIIRVWALQFVRDLPQPYTQPEYSEAKRYQQQPETALALDTGRLSAADYAALVVKDYEQSQRARQLRLSLIEQAKTIDEIEAVLGRL